MEVGCQSVLKIEHPICSPTALNGRLARFILYGSFYRWFSAADFRFMTFQPEYFFRYDVGMLYMIGTAIRNCTVTVVTFKIDFPEYLLFLACAYC